MRSIVLLVALLLLACESDPYTEETCDILYYGEPAFGERCCYGGGYQNGCDEVRIYDGIHGCVDIREPPSGEFVCQFVPCETFVEDLADCQ